MDEQAIPWEEIIATIVRRRRLIVRVAVAGVITVTLLAWIQPPAYKATAKLIVKAERAHMTVSPDANQRSVVSRTTEEEINSEVALLSSPSLILEVLEKHQDRIELPREGGKGSIQRLAAAVTYPLNFPTIAYRYVHGMPPVSPLDKWVRATAERLEVQRVRRSKLIEVSYTTRDPQWAAQFVNELLSRHIDHYTSIHEQSDAQHFFERQRALLGKKLRKAKSALKAFREGKGSKLPLQTEDELRTNVAQLESTRDAAVRELAEANARLAFLGAEIRKHPPSIAAESRVIGNQSVQFLKPRLLGLELQRAELLTKYAPGSSKVQDVQKQISEARRLLAKEEETISETMTTVNPAYQALQVDLVQTRAEMAALEARAEALSRQIVDYRAKLDRLDDMAAEQERLEQDVMTAKEAYLTYLKKAEQARLSSALDRSKIVNISIAEPARIPRSPAPSRRLLALILGGVMSLAAGVAMAFVRDRMDPSVKSAAQAQRATGLPVLAEIPL